MTFCKPSLTVSTTLSLFWRSTDRPLICNMQHVHSTRISSDSYQLTLATLQCCFMHVRPHCICAVGNRAPRHSIDRVPVTALVQMLRQVPTGDSATACVMIERAARASWYTQCDLDMQPFHHQNFVHFLYLR